ncbi:uncharacterized protein LOC135212255 [Macrobrachium nipponense]|uniref:uncharacterized protein LOC135212255 n=1 Tax=Macrobrachium nipponense TaxID=159736 RepID=UPI0030C8D0A9
MERLVLTYLLGVSLSSAADATVSTIRTISEGKSNNFFFFPRAKTWVLALKSAAIPTINYKYYASGKHIVNDKCDDCYGGSLWVPFVTITEKFIKRYDSPEQFFEDNVGSSQARNFSITSESPSAVELQALPLPLKGYQIVGIPFGATVNISLPDKEEVWLALWNEQKDQVDIHFNLYDETGPIDETFKAMVEEGWLIIRIYETKIIYGGNLHNLSKHGLKGRHLEFHNPSSLKYHLFSMPFEPKGVEERTDTDKPADTNLNLILIIVFVWCVWVFLSSHLALPTGSAVRRGKKNYTKALPDSLQKMNTANQLLHPVV